MAQSKSLRNLFTYESWVRAVAGSVVSAKFKSHELMDNNFA